MVSEMGKNRKLFFMDIFQLRLGITLLSKNKTLEMMKFLIVTLQSFLSKR